MISYSLAIKVKALKRGAQFDELIADTHATSNRVFYAPCRVITDGTVAGMHAEAMFNERGTMIAFHAHSHLAGE